MINYTRPTPYSGSDEWKKRFNCSYMGPEKIQFDRFTSDYDPENKKGHSLRLTATLIDGKYPDGLAQFRCMRTGIYESKFDYRFFAAIGEPEKVADGFLSQGIQRFCKCGLSPLISVLNNKD